VLEDKDATGILRPLLPLADTVTVTQVDHPRSLSANQLGKRVEAFSWQGSLMLEKDPTQALETVQRTADDRDIILVTGSLFLISEIRRLFL
jgi:dihydrofolate synthase/folylpolyglutamate synthase